MPRSDLLRLDRIDDHMSNGWQGGREGSRKIITHAIDMETLPFPVKIMMMRDRGDTCLGDKFRDCQTKRKVKRNRNCILDNQHFQHEPMREFIQLFF